MADNALFRFSSSKSLGASLDYLCTNTSKKGKNISGVDGVTLMDVLENKNLFLASVSNSLRTKQFQFSKLSPHFIKKANGKERVICIPTVKDRIVQRALNDTIAEKYAKNLDNAISYGFLKNKGVKSAATQACELRNTNPWVFKTDISAFFDQIPRDTLKRHVRKMIRESTLHHLIDGVIDCEIEAETPTAATRIQRQGIVVGKGIRQGMPLSPMLSNLMLRRFDTQVMKAGFKAVRYADDLIFFANNESQCIEIFNFCEFELNREGLQIPSLEAKTKSVIYSPTETAEFLGLALTRTARGNYQLEISQEQMHAIRAELFKLTDLSELNKRGIDFFKFGQALDSRIGGYSAAYSVCSNSADLDSRLKNMRDKIYKTVLESLGIKVSTLPSKTKQFFRL